MPRKKDPPDRAGRESRVSRGRRGWMVAYSSLLSSRWIISAMWPEDYDALLVHSTCIFTCLTYAEYQRTFKYLQRFDGTTASFIGTDTVGRLIILIRADAPHYIVTARLRSAISEAQLSFRLHDFMVAKKYIARRAALSRLSQTRWKFQKEDLKVWETVPS